jgi:hypothetical protein
MGNISEDPSQPTLECMSGNISVRCGFRVGVAICECTKIRIMAFNEIVYPVSCF